VHVRQAAVQRLLEQKLYILLATSVLVNSVFVFHHSAKPFTNPCFSGATDFCFLGFEGFT